MIGYRAPLRSPGNTDLLPLHQLGEEDRHGFPAGLLTRCGKTVGFSWDEGEADEDAPVWCRHCKRKGDR